MTLAQRILAAVQAEAEYHDEGDHQIAARDLALPEISNRDEVLAAIEAVLAEPRTTALRRLAVAAYDASMGTGPAETRGDAADATEDAACAVVDACGDRASADAWIDSLRGAP